MLLQSYWTACLQFSHYTFFQISVWIYCSPCQRCLSTTILLSLANSSHLWSLAVSLWRPLFLCTLHHLCRSLSQLSLLRSAKIWVIIVLFSVDSLTRLWVLKTNHGVLFYFLMLMLWSPFLSIRSFLNIFIFYFLNRQHIHISKNSEITKRYTVKSLSPTSPHSCCPVLLPRGKVISFLWILPEIQIYLWSLFHTSTYLPGNAKNARLLFTRVISQSCIYSE